MSREETPDNGSLAAVASVYPAPPQNTQTPQAPLRYGAPHGAGDTPLGLEQGESFVLLLIFYEVLHEEIGRFDILARMVSTYEKWTGKGKHRHVGISLGVRKNTQQIAVLPYDLSCWNSRLSGIGCISSDSSVRMPVHDRAAAGLRGNCISASDALYIDIDVGTVDQILQNYQLGSGAYVWNRLPMIGIRYPTIWTVIRDHVLYLLFYCRTPVILPLVDKEIDAMNREVQCAQYVLMLLVYMLKANKVDGATEKHKNSIYGLVYRKASLHPHTLWEVLACTGVFASVGTKCAVNMLQQFTRTQNTRDHSGKLADIQLANPYYTYALNEILVWEFKHTHLFP